MKRVLVLSDMHCGGASGMLPRDYYNADRDLHLQQSHVQEMLFEQWENMVHSVGAVDAVICNGDIVDGLNRKSKGKDIQVTDMMVQCDIARQLLSMIDCHRFIFTQGSNYHIGDNPSCDEMICTMMKGEWFGHFGDVMFDNITMNVQHWKSYSKNNHGGFDSMMGDIDQLRLQGDEADIYIRSHIHNFKYSGGSNYLAVATPCWKGMDGFTSEKSQKRPDNGYILFNIEGSDYSWDYNIFKIPKYFFVKHRNY